MYKVKFPANYDVIFTTYFTSKQNPQPDAKGNFSQVSPNEISYIYPWYISTKFLGLNSVVIHDRLSDEFVETYSHDKLQFIRYEPGPYSLNDERYFALEKILDQNRFNKVLLTDGSDVLIKKNPFEFFSDPNIIYFGSDEPNLPTIRDNPWCISKLNNIIAANIGMIEVDNSVLDFNYVNAGVFGGDYLLVSRFNKLLTKMLSLLNNDKNNNMMMINYLLWKFNIPHFKGQPLTSRFKLHELDGDYFIVHK